MAKMKQSSTSFVLAASVIVNGLLLTSAWAQSSLGEQLLNSAIGAAAKRLQEATPGVGIGTTPQQSPAAAQGGVQAPAQANLPPPRWPTKAALLEATRRGDFKGLPEIRFEVEKEMTPLTNSVFSILRAEYMVPPLPGNESLGTCRGAASGEIRRLLTAITDFHLQGLSTRPPTFFRETNNSSSQQNIAIEMRQLGKGGGWCTTKSMGDEKPHSYGLALAKLADEFSAATKAFVDDERGRRIAEYNQDQARIQADLQGKANVQAQREADVRAAEQKRIAAERARIEAEQLKRQQQEKNRVAG